MARRQREEGTNVRLNQEVWRIGGFSQGVCDTSPERARDVWECRDEQVGRNVGQGLLRLASQSTRPAITSPLILCFCDRASCRIKIMCRNIKTLHNFKPPATDEEIRASSLQFVRKLSGFTKPSKANEVAFNRAVDRVAQVAHELLQSLVTNAPPRDRDLEASKARARTAERFRSSDVTPSA